jgi:imidazolonepropionase-like amidohydrolase
MKKIRLILILAVVITSCSSPQHNLLITNVNVIDVVTGEVLSNRTVAIDGDSISAIYNKSIKPGNHTEVVDGTGKYLIPGLWDMHAHHHFWYQDVNPLLLYNGVTGIRELRSYMPLTKFLRQQNTSGALPGVDIYSTGVPINSTMEAVKHFGPLIFVFVENAEEAAEAANCQISTGVDFIKVYSLSLEAFDAIMEAAAKANIPVAGHVPENVPIRHAIKAGMRSMEHLYGIADTSISGEAKVRLDSIKGLLLKMETFESLMNTTWVIDDLLYNHLDLTLLDNISAELAKSDVWITPTMVEKRSNFYEFDSSLIYDSRQEYLPRFMRVNLEEHEISKPDEQTIETRKRYYETSESVLQYLVKNGVKILAGTDYGVPFIYPGFSLHDELEIFVQNGMTPLQALQTATINPSLAMKNDRIGSISKGKLASLVLLNQNPMDDINALRDIKSVILRGKVFSRGELDEMLTQTKRRADLPDAMDLFKDLETKGSLPDSFLALENKLDSLSESYNLSQLASTINRLGYRFLNKDDTDNARKVFESNIRLHPYNQLAWSGFAESFLKQGDTLKAVQYYQKALNIYPCNIELEKKLKELVQ